MIVTNGSNCDKVCEYLTREHDVYEGKFTCLLFRVGLFSKWRSPTYDVNRCEQCLHCKEITTTIIWSDELVSEPKHIEVTYGKGEA